MRRTLLVLMVSCVWVALLPADQGTRGQAADPTLEDMTMELMETLDSVVGIAFDDMSLAFAGFDADGVALAAQELETKNEEANSEFNRFFGLLDVSKWDWKAGGQSIAANADGSFRISNISAADRFGTQGPGSAPDFVSDDLVRVIGTSTVGGETQWVFSGPFQITQGQTYTVGDLVISQTPPPLPESIAITLPPTEDNLLPVGQTLQLTVTATLGDGTPRDVTPRTGWTVYRTSNPRIATVSDDGVVTGQGVGTAFITAVNEGTTATRRIDVVTDTATTTVEGFVLFDDGFPAAGAQITTNRGGAYLTDELGFFQFTLDVVASDSSVTVSATLESAGVSVVGAATATVITGGISDAGIITLSRAVTGPLFYDQQQFRLGDPTAVSIADLDGDGDADLAVTNSFDSNVSILLNNGDGTFADDVTYWTGRHPNKVSIADLDGDGDGDLAVAYAGDDYYDGKVSILLNNGDGTFADHVTYGACTVPVSVSIADLDADGDGDLAVGCHGDFNFGNVSILLNNGDGTFGDDVTDLYGPGRRLGSVSIADLDGDGDGDLAVTGGGLSILLNNGDGTFADEVLYEVGVVPVSVSIADLDGDGDGDLAVANSYSDNVSILLNNGDGTFADGLTYAAGGGPNSVSIADLDGDGDGDLAVANWASDNVSILLNNGDGTFADDLTYGAGDAPLSVSIADLDGDGDLDLGVANVNSHTVSILLNTRIP